METRPDYPVSQSSNTSDSAVKIATPDIILIKDEAIAAEIMADLIFQDIGGQEIINIARSDVINGQNVVYQPIKNITSLFYQYNPQNILALQKTDKDYFKNFAINLKDRLPEWPYVYIDEDTGDLVIQVQNMAPSESIEVQTISNVTVLDDTIYGEGTI
jgi:hypothetical protein